MGFLNRFRKSYGEFKEEKEKEKRELAEKKRVGEEQRQKELQKQQEEREIRENCESSTYLESLIRSGTKEIILDKNIIFASYIKIEEDDIIIDGRDYIFDGEGRVPFFLIKGKNITIKNVKFKNGHSLYFDSGVAEISEEASCKFIGCIFEDIFSSYNAAICNKGGKLEIYDSNFIHNYNKASSNLSNGGAIFNMGDLKLENCKFFECILYGHSNGGAICNYGKIDASSLNFYTNKSPNGGAIYNHGTLILKDSHFADNSSTVAGAILNEGNLEVYDTKFYNNHAVYVGAIANNGKMTLVRNYFEENHSTEGGAIGVSDNCKIQESTFFENSSEKGGAIFVRGTCDLLLTQCKFENNNSDNGLSIFNNEGHINLVRCEFFNHYYTDKHIIVNEASLDIFDTSFHDNNIEAVILNNSRSSLVISDSKFINNKLYRTLIENKGRLASITRTLFENNDRFQDNSHDIFNYTTLKLNDIKMNDSSSSIYNEGKIKIKSIPNSFEEKISSTPKASVEFSDSLEDEESASVNISGSVDSDEESGSEDVSGSVAFDNESESIMDVRTKGLESNVTQDITDKKTVSIYNFSYLDNLIQEIRVKELLGEETNKEIILDHDIELDDDEVMFYEGGIVLDIDDLIIDGNNFSISGENLSRIFLIAAKNITLKNIKFVRGFADKNYQGFFKSGGGAILSNSFSDFKMENCKFYENESLMYGGALHNRGTANLENTEFSTNVANRGGAIANEGSIYIKISHLENNTAEDHGGAIANLSNMELIDANLFNNGSKNYGYAIMNWGDLKVDGSKFIKNNEGREEDSVLYNVTGSSLIISNTCFKENSVTAINNSKNCKCEITNSKFIAGGDSAINNLGELFVDGSYFESNIARFNGGAINSESSLTVTNSVFDGNSSNIEGGAIYQNGEYTKLVNVASVIEGALKIEDHNHPIIVRDSIFKNNQANDAGGAISFFGDYEFDNLKFENNESSIGMDIANVKEGCRNYKEFKVDFFSSSIKSKYFEDEENGLFSSLRELPNDDNDEDLLSSSNESTDIEEASDESIDIEDTQDEKFDSWGHDFKYLDDLIHSGVKKISLDDDVVITYEELSNYPNGIKLDVDDLEIEGNKKTISAQGKTRIFEIFGKNISLKDLTLSNGTSDEGGAIYVHEDSHLKMRNVFVMDSHAKFNGGGLYNKGKLEFRNVSFIDNIAKENNGGGIFNDKTGDMSLMLCGFYTNEAGENGGGIYNIGPMEIKKNSRVFQNKAKKGGGMYLTNLEAVIKDKRGNSKLEVPLIKLSDVGFVSNTAEDSDGALAFKDEKKLKLKKCKFNTNSPKGKFD